MLDRCLKCHPGSLVSESLNHADTIKHEADATLQEMHEIVRRLEHEGILARDGSGKPDRTGHPVLLGGEQIIKGTSRIERLYFDAFKVWHPLMWKAAYHNAPTKVIEARRKLDMILAAMKDEAARLRDGE